MLFQLPSVYRRSLLCNKTNPPWNGSERRKNGKKSAEITWVPTTKVESVPLFCCFMYYHMLACVSGHDFHAQHFYMIHDSASTEISVMSKARKLSLVARWKINNVLCRRSWEYIGIHREHCAIKTCCSPHQHHVSPRKIGAVFFLFFFSLPPESLMEGETWIVFVTRLIHT